MSDNSPVTVEFNVEEFAKFADAAWRGRDPSTCIFVGALPTKANDKRGKDLKAAKQPVPVECRAHWRSFGPAEADALLRFVRHENGTRNLAVKMARFKSDASSGHIQNVQQITFAWLDIDARSPEGKQRVCDILWGAGVPRPSCVVSSGGGIHAYWFYTQPLQDKDFDTARSINEHLARVFAGDQSVTHVAGSLRLPGSWNANRNAPCSILHLDPDERHDPTQLLRWLDKQGPHVTMNDAGEPVAVPEETRAGLRAHEKEAENANGGKTDWDAVAQALAIEGSANPYGGRNRALTLWAGKVIAMGGSLEEIVSLAKLKGCTLPEEEITATCESVVRTHERKNGVIVPRTKAARLAEAENKSDEPVGKNPPEEQGGEVQAGEAAEAPDMSGHGVQIPGGHKPGYFSAPGADGGDGGDRNGHPPLDSGDAGDFDPTSAIARLKALIAKGLDEDEDYSFAITKSLQEVKAALDEWWDNMGTALIYEGDGGDAGWWWVYVPTVGVWEERTRKQIEMAVERFWIAMSGMIPKSADMKEIMLVLERAVHRPLNTVPWDQGFPDKHLIVSANGLIVDVLKGETLAPDKDMYLTSRRMVAADYDPAATCPVWDAAIRMMFDDSVEKDRIATMIEEWMGSAVLGPNRPRDTYKALMLTGESLGGKSSLGHALRSVMGDDHVSAAGMDTVSGPFGLSTFFEKRASVWICDDPDAAAKLPDGIIKKLITNETININVKRKSLRDERLGLTVGIFCNEMPRIEDTSDAVYNRMLMLRSGIIFTTTPDKSDPHHRMADPQLADKFKAERAGILNRMIEGARRLMSNGNYTMPAAVAVTREEVHDLHAPSRAFIKTCLQAMPNDQHCVRRVHLRQAFVGFMESENPGWYRTARNVQWEMRRFYKALHAIFPASAEQRSGKLRGTPAQQMVQTRINLTKDGLAYLAVGKGVESGTPDQSYENDPEVKHANDLMFKNFDAQSKPKLKAVGNGEQDKDTAAGE